MNAGRLSDRFRSENAKLGVAMQAYRFVADIMSDQPPDAAFKAYLVYECEFVESAMGIFGHRLMKAPGPNSLNDFVFELDRNPSKVLIDHAFYYAPSSSLNAFLNDARRMSRYDAIRRHVIHDDAGWANDAVISDIHAGENDAASGNMTIFTDPSIQPRLLCVVVCKNTSPQIYHCAVAYMDTSWISSAQYCGE